MKKATGNKHIPLARLETLISQPIHSPHCSIHPVIAITLTPPVTEVMTAIAPTALPCFNLLSLPISWRAELCKGYDFSERLNVRNVYICKC